MNREDSIRMAREVWSAGEVYIGPSENSLVQFAAIVAAAAKAEENEACAKVCDELHWTWHMGDDSGPKECAAAIRARKEAT